MKLIFKLVLISLVLITIYSCGNDYPPDVDVKGKVLDSILNENKSKIKPLFDKIDELDIVTSLLKRTVILDSLDDGNKIYDNIPDLNEFITDSLDITLKNTLLINNKDNIMDFMGKIEDSTKSKLKTNYVITQLSKYSYSDEISPIDNSPHFFDYYNDNDYFKSHYNDSITKKEKEWLINKNTILLKNLEDIKYAIVVNDLLYKPGKVINLKSFEGSILVTNAQIYNINSKLLLGQTTFITQNRDNIAHLLTTDAFGMGEMYLNLRIRQDLSQEKNKKIIEFFGLK